MLLVLFVGLFTLCGLSPSVVINSETFPWICPNQSQAAQLSILDQLCDWKWSHLLGKNVKVNSPKKSSQYKTSTFGYFLLIFATLGYFWYFWLLLAAFGYFWLNLATFGFWLLLDTFFFFYFWLLLATVGYFWLLLATLGYFGQNLAKFCYFWLLLATVGYF